MVLWGGVGGCGRYRTSCMNTREKAEVLVGVEMGLILCFGGGESVREEVENCTD